MPFEATASMLDHQHERTTFEVDNTICDDIDAHSVWSVVENDSLKLARSGFPLESGSGRGTVTFTALDTGKSVSFNWAGAFRDLRAIDNGDGTYTVEGQQVGREWMILDDRIVDRWTGRVRYRNVIDANGTPALLDDDTVLESSLVLASGGPHAEPLDGCAVLEQ